MPEEQQEDVIWLKAQDNADLRVATILTIVLQELDPIEQLLIDGNPVEALGKLHELQQAIQDYRARLGTVGAGTNHYRVSAPPGCKLEVPPVTETAIVDWFEFSVIRGDDNAT